MAPPKSIKKPLIDNSTKATEPLNNKTPIQDIITALGETYIQRRMEGRRRAKLAFQAYCDTELSYEAAPGQTYSDVTDLNRQKIETRRLIINSNLDADSVLDFVEIVITEQSQSKATN